MENRHDQPVFSVIVWCGIFSDKAIGPFLLITIYIAKDIQTFYKMNLKAYFQHIDGPPRTLRVVCVCPTTCSRLDSQCRIHLLAASTSTVFSTSDQTKPNAIEKLVNRMRSAIRSAHPQIIRKVLLIVLA